MTDPCQHKHVHNEKLERDPTRTTNLRKKFIGDFRNRNDEVRGTIRAALTDVDALKLKQNVNQGKLEDLRRFDFSTDQGKLEGFSEWMDDLLDDEYIERKRMGTGRWTDTYIQVSHQRGLKQADAKLKRAGMKEIPAVADIDFDAVQSMPVHEGKIKQLYSRTFQGVKGITDEQSKQVSRILSEGLTRGQSPYEIADRINSELLKVHNVNSKTLARTEIINAHAEATLDRFEQVGVQRVSGQAEFSTAGDMRVCDICASLQGEIMSTKEARGLIPVHPQCRCAWLPVFGDDIPEFDRGLFPTSTV